MTSRVVAVGGSAGAIEPLVEFVGGLPADLPACVLVTMHIGENVESRLPQVLTRSGPLSAEHAVDGQQLEPGRILIAPPGRHVLVRAGSVRLSAGPRVNRHRPAVDVMFGSAARHLREPAVAVVLSGVLDDGAVGAALVARAGGHVVVQDPADAAFGSMPRAALAAVPRASVVAGRRLAAVVGATVIAVKEGTGDVMTEASPQMSMGRSDDPHFLAADESRLTRMACPDCGGSLAEIDLPEIRFYRCHIGHQYGPRSLEAAQADAAEHKLWAAVAALEDHAAFARHLAEHAAATDRDDLCDAADRAADLAESMHARLRERRPDRRGPAA